MYRLRLHGRGGQGMKTAARILGSAFFDQGFEVQDAPRYGAERRGAPIFATVRAAREPINERGAIHDPGLVVVADETLVSVATAGVLSGVSEDTVLLMHSNVPAEVWKDRLKVNAEILVLPASIEDTAELRFIGASCAGAAAHLVGLPFTSLEHAICEELADMTQAVRDENIALARVSWLKLSSRAGCVKEGAPVKPTDMDSPWVDLPFEEARISAPDVHAAATSVAMKTGSWRTMRPVIDLEHCNRCHWICSTLCPDSAIFVDSDGAPQIDYEHCKGCLVCAAVCPPHAIRAIPERQARAEEGES